jgi:hypothetical protein
MKPPTAERLTPEPATTHRSAGQHANGMITAALNTFAGIVTTTPLPLCVSLWSSSPDAS